MTSAASLLVYRLHEERSRWRWPGSPDPRLPILAEIGRLGERATLPALLGPLVEGGAVGVAAAGAAGAILDGVPVGDLGAAEAVVRGRAWMPAPDRTWADLSAAALAHRAPAGWLRTPYYGVASFHRDGHVREAAVRALAGDRTERALPFLVLRLNDWVGPVRRVAERSVRARLASGGADAWGRVLPLVLGLRERGRHDASDVVDGAVRLLTAPENAEALRTALVSDDRAVRRAAYEVALAAGGGAAEMASRVAVDDPDLVVRLGVAGAVRAGRVVDAAVERALLLDPAHGVRREVLLGLVEREAPEADAALRAAVLDAHGSVRHDARYFASKRAREAVDFAELYRQALSDAARSGEAPGLRAALGGLAETGGPADAARALPHLGDWRASVRAAALRAVIELAAREHAGAIVAAAEDPSSRVARTAAEAVANGIPGVDAETVFGRLLSGPSSQVRAQALRALAHLPHWSALPHLLRAAVHPDAATARRAAEGLERWAARSVRVFTSPTAGDVQEAREGLAAAARVAELRDVVGRVRSVLGRAVGPSV